MATMPEGQVAKVEEHLLACAVCQERLAETDTFIRSIQHAAARLQAEQQRTTRRWPLPRPVPALAASLVVVAIAVTLHVNSDRPAVPISVELSAMRGSIRAQAPAGRPLLLHPNVEGLQPSSQYHLEIVDRFGRRDWEATFAPASQGIRAPGQSAGTYFVRLYSASGNLLREYGLQLQSQP